MKKLALISTHPIQYNAPWFALLAKESGIQLKVFYTWSQRQTDLFDEKFGEAIEWDIPLLEGYDYTFVKNTSKKPGTKHFQGIQCPTLNKEIEEWGATHLLVFGWNYLAHLKAMRYFKGKIQVLFRGDSTLLDYDIRSIKTVVSSFKSRKLILSTFKNYLEFKLRKFFLTFIYKKIDTALYVGQNNKAYFIAHGLKEHQLTHVPHAIDNDRFFDSQEKQYEQKARLWRHELGIKEEDSVILFAGKFEPKKAPFLLLDAFKQLKYQHINPDFQDITCSATTLKLLFLGAGPLEKQLKQDANENPDIKFIPFQNQSQMPVVYRLANLFCLPSIGPNETWGLAVNEAIACSRPVVMSDKVGCAADLALLPNRVFKSKDTQDLVHQLSVLIKQIQNKQIEKDSIRHQIEPWCFQAIADTIRNVLAG